MIDSLRVGVIGLCVSIGVVVVGHSHEIERDSQLAAQIEHLIRDSATVPSDTTNIKQRLQVFWPWVNSYALAGLPIDPDVPATVARIQDPGPTANISTLDLADIDNWIREFSYREKHPTAIGTLSSPKLSGFEVDQHHALEIVYTVGSRPLVAGDGFVLGELTYGKGPLLQARDPRAENFVSIRTDSATKFDVEGYPIRGMFSGTMKRSVVMTGPAQKIFFRLKEGTLAPGAKITITLGDQSFGSPGVGLIAPSVDALRFRVWLHLDQEQLLMALPELQFQSVGGVASGVRGFGPSVVGVGEPFSLTIRFEDQFRNLAQGEMPAATVRLGDVQLGGKVLVTIPAGREGVVKLDGLSFSEPGVYRPQVHSPAFDVISEVNPILVQADVGDRVYWGETHGHSGFSEGMGSVDGVYKFARDQARLDFMALTEHDYWMDDAEWEVLRAAAQEYNDPGNFLAFLAYEWTVHAKNGGHHNIIYRTPAGRQRVPRQEVQTLSELYEGLAETAKSEDLLIIPHAHNPGDWALTDPSNEKFVEIVSLHGTFEWFGRRYLEQGHMVGFLGGSDDHMGHPGLRPLRRNPTSDNFGGLLGLYAKEKTNDAVFDAMRSIHGYATNGVRSILMANLNGQRMGTKVPAAANLRLRGHVYATAPIEEITVIKNGRPVHFVDYRLADRESETLEVRFWSDSYPRSKGALARQWRRWRGVIELAGANIDSVSSPQNDNPYTEYARQSAPDAAEFFLKTRGSIKSALVDFADRAAGSKLIVRGIKESPLPGEAMQPFSFEVPLDKLKDKPIRLDVETESYDDHIQVRWAKQPQLKDVQFDYQLPDELRDGDYVYLRVRQVDGGLVWSSPFQVEDAGSD